MTVEDDPMTTETARMFYERALKAEAEVARLREYIEAMPFPSDVHSLDATVHRLADALREIANQDFRGNRSTESQIAYRALEQEGLA